MINMTDAEKEAWASGNQKFLHLVFDDGTEIDNSLIAQESMSIEETLSDENNLVYGKCSASVFKIRLLDTEMSYKGKRITVSIDVDEYTKQLGVYTIEDDARDSSKKYKDIVAYDDMYRIANTNVAEWYNGLEFTETQFNVLKGWNIGNYSADVADHGAVDRVKYPFYLHRGYLDLDNGDIYVPVYNEAGGGSWKKLGVATPYDYKTVCNIGTFRESLFHYLGVEQVTKSFILDTMSVEKTIDAEVISGLEIIENLCQAFRVFGHINNLGQFDYIDFPYTSYSDNNTFYPSEYAMNGLNYQDYVIDEVTKVIIRDSSDDVGVAYGKDGNTYIVEGNIFLKNRSEQELTDIASWVKPAKVYQPASLRLNYQPQLELGDFIKAIGINGEEIIFPILHRSISGITALKDVYEAKGEKTYGEQVNSLSKTISNLNGKYNKISATVDGLEVEVGSIKEVSNVSTWMIDEIPTLENYPVTEFDDVANHVGDLAIGKKGSPIENYTYRFTVEEEEVEHEVTDEDGEVETEYETVYHYSWELLYTVPTVESTIASIKASSDNVSIVVGDYLKSADGQEVIGEQVSSIIVNPETIQFISNNIVLDGNTTITDAFIDKLNVNSILVKDTDENIIFKADANENIVKLAGFEIEQDRFFYDILEDEKEGYTTVRNIWKHFEINTFGLHSEIVVTDVETDMYLRYHMIEIENGHIRCTNMSNTPNPWEYCEIEGSTISIGNDVIGTQTFLDATSISTTSFTGKYFNSYVLGRACEKNYTDSTSNSAISTGTSLTTERDVYYGLCAVNGSSQTRATTIYAPTTAGNKGYVPTSGGSGAPAWRVPLSTQSVVGDNITVGKQSYKTGTIDVIADVNYEPVGVCAFQIGNASSSGVNSSKCFFSQLYYSGGQVHYQLNNYHTADAKVKITIYLIRRPKTT